MSVSWHSYSSHAWYDEYYWLLAFNMCSRSEAHASRYSTTRTCLV